MQEMQRNPEMMRQMMASMGGAGGGGAAGGGALGGMQNMLAQNPEMLAQMMQVYYRRSKYTEKLDDTLCVAEI